MSLDARSSSGSFDFSWDFHVLYLSLSFGLSQLCIILQNRVHLNFEKTVIRCWNFEAAALPY